MKVHNKTRAEVIDFLIEQARASGDLELAYNEWSCHNCRGPNVPFEQGGRTCEAVAVAIAAAKDARAPDA